MGVVHSIAQGVADNIEIGVPSSFVTQVHNTDADFTTGHIKGTLEVKNSNPIAVDARIEESPVWAEFPLRPGFEDMAGVMGWFNIPKLYIGIGTKHYDFESDFHITNKTIWDKWSAQLQNNHDLDLNIHLKPDCSVLDVIDPWRYRLNVDKHLSCAPSPKVAASEGEHYGKPPCRSDEHEKREGNLVICAADCQGSSKNCPTDMASVFAPRFGVSCEDPTSEFPGG